MAAPKLRGMILAAGRGERLRPLTLFRAKPAVPFLNRPLIHNSLALLEKAGIESVVINTHHLPDTVVEAVRSFCAEHPNSFSSLHYSHEPEILGTAGAIGAARHRLAGDTFVVSNGKIYFEGSLAAPIHFHLERDSIATLVLAPLPDRSDYNPVWLDPQQRVVGFGEAFRNLPGLKAFAFTGIHILDGKIHDFIPPGPSETVLDLYPRLIEAELPVGGFVSDDLWCECSTPRRYLSNSLDLLARSGRTNLMGQGSTMCHRVVADTSVVIESGCQLQRCILWDQVEVGSGSVLHDTIVTTGVKIPAGVTIRSAVVTPKPIPEVESAKPLPGSNRFCLWPL